MCQLFATGADPISHPRARRADGDEVSTAGWTSAHTSPTSPSRCATDPDVPSTGLTTFVDMCVSRRRPPGR